MSLSGPALSLIVTPQTADSNVDQEEGLWLNILFNSRYRGNTKLTDDVMRHLFRNLSSRLQNISKFDYQQLLLTTGSSVPRIGWPWSGSLSAEKDPNVYFQPSFVRSFSASTSARKDDIRRTARSLAREERHQGWLARLLTPLTHGNRNKDRSLSNNMRHVEYHNGTQQYSCFIPCRAQTANVPLTTATALADLEYGSGPRTGIHPIAMRKCDIAMSDLPSLPKPLWPLVPDKGTTDAMKSSLRDGVRAIAEAFLTSSCGTPFRLKSLISQQTLREDLQDLAICRLEADEKAGNTKKAEKAEKAEVGKVAEEARDFIDTLTPMRLKACIETLISDGKRFGVGRGEETDVVKVEDLSLWSDGEGRKG